jgi:3-oxoacyl-[acyl-carrier protein] reductase
LESRAPFGPRAHIIASVQHHRFVVWIDGHLHLMELGLQGKRALVLGASSGLGRAVALGLAREGVSVVVSGRDRDRLNDVAREMSEQGGHAVVAPVDLARPDATSKLVDQVRAAFGDIDILVNNSGGPPPATVSTVPSEAWRQHFEAMVLRQMELAQRFLPGMRNRGFGRILTIASSAVIEPIVELGISSTLRASLVTWSKCLASEVAADRVTVNVLIPGRIATRRVEDLDTQAASRLGISAQEVQERQVQAIPLRRYGRPEEFADVAVFLASERASYVTGSMVRIDGGALLSVG